MSLAAGDIDGLRIAFGGLLATLLLALAAHDLKAMILPDRLNVMLAGAGVGQSLMLGLPELRDAALGSIIGGGLMGGLAALFRRLRSHLDVTGRVALMNRLQLPPDRAVRRPAHGVSERRR